MPVVVLFKSESDGPDKFAKLLEDNNFDVRAIACLDFQFKNSKLLSEKLSSAEDYAGLIFTSQRAVRAVDKAVERRAVLADWAGKTNYSVGESTSELARSLLELETQGQLSGNANELAGFIISKHKEESKPLLFPSGNLKQDVLEKSLKDQAIEVESVEAYETVQHPTLDESIEVLKSVEIDFLVFFSPSGIKFSLPILKKHEIDLRDLKIIALGPSTRKSLEESGLECHRMCSSPTPGDLLAALTRPSGE